MKIRSAPWHLSRAAVTDRSMATKLFTQTLWKKSTNLAQTLCLVLSVSGAVLKLDQKFEKVRYAKLTASFACLGSKTWTKKVFENCCGFCDALRWQAKCFCTLSNVLGDFSKPFPCQELFQIVGATLGNLQKHLQQNLDQKSF